MKTLEEDKIIRFRNKLYQKKVPGIMKSGSKDLNPMEKSKVDGQGKIIVLTSEIIAFFFFAIEKEDSLNADQYISNLYLLFDILTKEAEDYSFQSDMRVPEKDIEEADNKITIEYLTKNIIIAYFNQVKLPGGAINHDLLDPDLKTIINLSNEGRDYRTLVGKVLENLIETLKLARPWRQSFGDVENAALVCRLVGARLPRIEKEVLSRIVSESRAEIKKDIALFTKVLNTRDQILQQGKDHKNYIKVMDKLDQAIAGLLKRINDYLGYVYRFIALIGASVQGFLGQADANLKMDIAKFFFEYEEINPETPQAKTVKRFSSLRYRMAMLFDYPEITIFSRSLQKEEQYRDCILDCFKLYFNELIKQMEVLFFPTGPKDFKIIETRLSEITRMVKNLEFEPSALEPSKKEIHKKYLSLLRVMPLEHLSLVIHMKEDLCIAIQDESKSLMEDIRKALAETCHIRLKSLVTESLSFDEFHQETLKLLTGYAQNYKPQRFFYQRFFEQYIATSGGSLSIHMSDLLEKNKPVAIKLLEIFSNPKYMGDFISKGQIAFSGELLKKFQKR
ncbi:MAG: hypothetical protein A2277_12150 [Desulfobacterales bacterium RIFOXYA12_FULL_46_15]|nr:MAG: hypothetical protein A2097_03500 [Desulfobacula sp. GWF2_41_7]OGR25656.1 MAG: hypothetical protein A2277_12150 [Desulfobacterales bacterium RIFOXYA12_FULL_46_15]